MDEARLEPPAPPAAVRRSAFLHHIWRRIHRHGKNAIVAITGEPGSGKSWAGLRLCEAIDPGFEAADICFDPESFLLRLSSTTPRRGRARLYDEAGVGSHNRNWYDVRNKEMVHVFETFRLAGELTVLTAPYPSMIDSQLWRLCHYWVHMGRERPGLGAIKRIIPREEFKGRPLFYTYLRARIPEVGTVVVDCIRFEIPSPPLVAAYEAAALVVKRRLQVNAHERVREAASEPPLAKRARLLAAMEEAIRARPAEWTRTLKSGEVRIDRDRLVYRFGLTATEARPLVAELRRKLAL
ncbi:MAG: hypothetical protein ACYDDF_12530 [Thermoplasmatota archaeon]